MSEQIGLARVSRLMVLAGAAWLLWAGCAAAATTFVVNSGADELGLNPGNGRCETAPGNGVCTFRRALWEAERKFRLPNDDVTIVLAAPGGLIRLDRSAGIRVPVGGRLAILGAGQDESVIEASPVYPWQFPLELSTDGFDHGASVRMSGLTIRGLSISGGRASLALDHMTIADAPLAALLWVYGDATLTGCTIVNNGLQRLGGFSGIVFLTMGLPPRRPRLVIRHSTLHGNHSVTSGGALYASQADVELDAVTVSDNHGENGGGIYLDATASLRAVNTTFSGNRADDSGGAIFLAGRSSTSGLAGTAVLVHSTLTENIADADRNGFGLGGGIALGNEGVALAEVTLDHTILAGNQKTAFVGGVWTPTPGECAGPLTTTGPTLMTVVDCPVTGVAPTIGPANLAPLQNNGGLTSTHLPLAGSAAIDGGAAPPCLDATGAPLRRDQRGGTRGAGAACDLGAVEGGGALITKARSHDLNGDGTADLLWHWHGPWTAQHAAWLMDGASITTAALFPIDGDPGWDIAASDDFDADGRADLLWRHRVTGGVAIWLMDGLTVREASVLPTVDLAWRVAGTGDVDADGRADIVWELAPGGLSSGRVALWLIDGTAIKGWRTLPAATGWHLAALGDTNADGAPDLLWRHPSSGATVLWLLANVAITSTVTLPTVTESGWSVRALADLSGDGKADVLWQHEGGQAALWLLDGGALVGAGYLPLPPPGAWTIGTVADTDGDARGDLIWRTTSGDIIRWQMNGLAVVAADPLPSVGPWQIR